MSTRVLFIILCIHPVISCLAQAVDTDKLLSTEEFLMIKERVADLVLLDVRTPREIAGGHIEGAKFYDYRGADFEEKIRQLDRSKIYVVYCASGIRSQRVLQMMEILDFEIVYDLEGGYHQFILDTNDE